RSVAPPTIRTTDIYWGAAPFVVIQVIMVALIIAFPSLVTLGLDRPTHTGQPAPIQLLMPQDNRGGANRDDAADLFRQLQPSEQ
ncbi:MAG: C4-dicarboxylate ABC transporter, partial [Candidatus Competibacteraceae bacterium]|nr:C4-dicarboxylate ABC transporter [Candidatus Competibacteraceae bacterium]